MTAQSQGSSALANRRLREIAAGLLATANHIDPGMSATPDPSSNPKTRAKQDAMKQHYAAYGLRWAVFELFPDLEPGESS